MIGMTEKARNKSASYGLEILKLSVLCVLNDAFDNIMQQKLLTAKAIRESLDLPIPEYTAANTNSLIYGVLSYLADEGYVRHHVHEGWIITDEGRSFIEG